MRLLIDLQGAQTDSRFRGIGRYSLSLAHAIARQNRGHEIFLLLNARLPQAIPSLRETFSALVPPERIKIFDVPDCADGNRWRTRTAEIIREHYIASLDPDAVLLTSLFEQGGAVTSVGRHAGAARTAVVLYDLIPLLNPDKYLSVPEYAEFYHRRVDCLKNAGLLLSISDYSKQEAQQHLELPPERVIPISTASVAAFKPMPLDGAQKSALLSKHRISRSFVLYTPGGGDFRKNFNRLIEAWSLLPDKLRATHQLVIVGKIEPAPILRMAEKHGLADGDLVMPGYVSDDDLMALYSAAAAFIFPSIHEGFGLPALEAMSCGAPTIGSNCTSVPEVIGLEDALFDPFSPASIAEKLVQVLTKADFRELLARHGPIQAKSFSWDISALKAIEAIEKMAAHSPPGLVPGMPLLDAIAAIDPALIPTGKDLVQTAACIDFNFMRPQGKRLLLDVSSIVHTDAKSGIQRVVRSLLAELFACPPAGYEIRPVYFDGKVYRYADRFSGKFQGRPHLGTREETLTAYQGDVYLALDLIMHLTNATHPHHVEMAARGVEINFVVYDILLVHHPEWWPPGTSDMFVAWLRNISKVARGLTCISAAVADEVKDWLAANMPEDRIGGGIKLSSFHLGADIENSVPSRGFPEDAARVLASIKSKTSFLMVGTVEPRKGHTLALDAFEKLWSSGLDVNLVIVGKKGWMIDALAARLDSHQENGKRLFWLAGISDEYLEKVYAACSCLLAASEGEGFGLPLIEGAQHKLPIIARDLPVFREVAGQHAHYFPAAGENTLEPAIREWLGLHKGGRHPQSRDLPWLTWKQSAEQLKTAIFQRE